MLLQDTEGVLASMCIENCKLTIVQQGLSKK